MQSKLQFPRSGKKMIPRSRLLDQTCHFSDKKITCVVAPAGYGKTTFAMQFAKRASIPCMWYHLDRTDNDPVQFYQYLTAGLEKVIPGADLESPVMDDEEISPENRREFLLNSAVCELEKKSSDGLLLVFDDFHLISEPEILRFLERLITCLPPFVHAVLACRYLPDINLLRLRASGLVQEVGQRDLAFSRQEINALFDMNDISPASGGAMERLRNTMDGWPLGLAVLKFYRNFGDLKEEAVSEKSQKELFHYFLNDLMNDLPGELRSFLIRTSVLEELTPKACDFLLDSGHSAGFLSRLEQINLFMTASGGGGELSFRLHPLFREFLLTQLSDGKSSAYERAGRFYESRDFFEQAIPCYFSAGLDGLAAKCIEKSALFLLSQGKVSTVEHWMRHLGEKGFPDTPGLILARGALFSYKGNFVAAEPWIDRAMKLYCGGKNPAAMYWLTIHKARILRYRSSFQESLNLLDSLSMDSKEIPFEYRMEAAGEIIYSLWLSGNVVRAIETAERAIAEAKSHGKESGARTVNRLLAYMAVLYYNQGEYTNALLYYQSALKANGWNYDALEFHSVNLFAAWIERERGDPEKAISMMKESVGRKKRLGFTEDLHLLYYNMSLASHDLHDELAARLYMDLALQSFRDSGGSLEHYTEMMEAIRYTIFSDSFMDFDTAEKMLDSCVQKLTRKKDSLLLYSSFHFAVAYLRIGRREKAKSYLELPLKMSRQTGLKQFVALLSGLMANILISEGEEAAALPFASVSIRYSAAEQYVQTYLTFPEMRPCLRLAIENEIEPDFCHRLILRLGPQAEPQLIELLKSPKEPIRLKAAEWLIQQGGPVSLLEILFYDSSEAVREKAFAFLRSGAIPDHLRRPMYVRCMGPFEAFSAEDWERPLKWRTAKAKELFSYLIHWKGRPVPTERILGDLWPDASPEKGRDLFHTNLTYIKSILKRCGLEDSLNKTQPGYWLDPSRIVCDSWLLESGELLYCRGKSNGLYLEDVYSDWPAEKRSGLEARFSDPV